MTLSLQAISDIWPRREDARAPTRSPQGGRARQNAAKNPADLHAGRFARRAQARVAAEGNARGGGERAHRERVPPQPRQRRGQPPPAQAAPSRVSGGAVAEAGAAIPERSEAERGSA